MNRKSWAQNDRSQPFRRAAVHEVARGTSTALKPNPLVSIPLEVEWLANIVNPRTRRAYQIDIRDFAKFADINGPEDLRSVVGATVIAWRSDLERRGLSRPTIRRKLAALSALFSHLCDANAVAVNPTHGVERPKTGAYEGKTPAISDAEARALLDAPSADTTQGMRDRAILSILLYHGLRRDELCRLKVRDLERRAGVPHFRVEGKGSKIRYIPVHPRTLERIEAYLVVADHRLDLDGALFRPLKNPLGGVLAKQLSGTTVLRRIVKRYGKAAGVHVIGLCVHSLRATAATNALEHAADITKVQDWLGHAYISTTRLYDRRRNRPEDSPTFRIDY